MKSIHVPLSSLAGGTSTSNIGGGGEVGGLGSSIILNLSSRTLVVEKVERGGGEKSFW